MVQKVSIGLERLIVLLVEINAACCFRDGDCAGLLTRRSAILALLLLFNEATVRCCCCCCWLFDLGVASSLLLDAPGVVMAACGSSLALFSLLSSFS